MCLLSISIDLVDSTRTKQQISSISKNDPANIRKIYSELAKQLYLMETNLYFQTVNDGLDMKKFFVVKTIGDEIWVVYDIGKTPLQTIEFNTIFFTILKALLDITSRSYSICITNRSLTENEENNPNLQKKSNIKFTPKPLIPKVYLDVIKTYEEISVIRYNTLIEQFGSFFKIGTVIQKVPTKEKKEIINRLNIGTVEKIQKKKITISYRFDPLGFDVDHFFRATKEAKPALVACGKRLIDGLYFERPWDTKLNYLNKCCQLAYGTNGAKHYEYLNVIWVKIPPRKLKGINEEYRVCYPLYSNPNWNTTLTKEANSKNLKQKVCKESLKLLRSAGFFNKRS